MARKICIKNCIFNKLLLLAVMLKFRGAATNINLVDSLPKTNLEKVFSPAVVDNLFCFAPKSIGASIKVKCKTFLQRKLP